MPNEVMLEIYSFQIRKKGAPKDFEKLSTFTSGKDFLDFIYDYFQNHSKSLLGDEKLKKKIQVPSNGFRMDKTKRTVSGVIRSGDYGTSSTILDPEGNVKYRKKPHDSDMQPFYYLVYVPKKLNIGFIVLQRIGVHGINKIFAKNLEFRLNQLYPDLKIEINQFIAKSLARKIADEGAIRQIILRRNNLPSDIADKFGLQKLDTTVKSVQVKITTDAIAGSQKVKKYLKGGDTAFFEIPEELKEMGFNGSHKTMLKVDINGRMRTVDMSDSGKIRPYFDIDEEVEKNISGHPKYVSIDKIAKDLIFDLTSDFADEKG